MRIKFVIILLHTFWKPLMAEGKTLEINSDEFIEKMLNLELLKKETPEDISFETPKDFDDLIEEILERTSSSHEKVELLRIKSPSEDQESSSTTVGKSFPIITGIVNRDERRKPPILIYEDLEDSDNSKEQVQSLHKVPYPEYTYKTRYGIPLIGGFNYALGGSEELFKTGVGQTYGNSGWNPSVSTTSLYFIKPEDKSNEDSYSSYVPSDQFNLSNKGTNLAGTTNTKGSNYFAPHVNFDPFSNLPQSNSHNNIRHQPPQTNYDSSYSTLNNNDNNLKGTLSNNNNFHPVKSYQGSTISNTPQRPGGYFNISNRNEIERKNDFQNSAVQKYYIQQNQNVRPNQPRVKAHYDFGYTVTSQGTSHGHQESRRGNRVEGVYHVDLPNGYRQIVRYYADETGYHPTITYIPLHRRYAKSLSKDESVIKGKSIEVRVRKNQQPPLTEDKNTTTRGVPYLSKILSRRNIIGTHLPNTTENSKVEETEGLYLTTTTLMPKYIS
ncbi:UNVERIFIED_CONTAM: hypothetical protein RMT77_007519 [Armadillidium vulgare]